MDILDQAIDFEMNGHKYYTEHAAAAQNPAVKTILENLADDELKHAEVLREIKSGAAKEFPPTQSMHRIRDVIKESSLNDVNWLKDEVGILEVLETALDFEEKAKNRYREEAIKAEHPDSVEILTLLAEEEDKHYVLIKNLIEFIDNPQNILESQEFQFYDD